MSRRSAILSVAASTGPWLRICALDEIPRLGARVVRRAEADIAIFRTAEDTVFALRDRCPHRAGPLSQGIVFGHHVACPLHNWTIALADGVAAAPDVGCTAHYAVRVEAGMVYLDPTPRMALEAAGTPHG